MERPIPAHSPLLREPVAFSVSPWGVLYYLHTGLVAGAAWLARVAYFQPMFRARCAAVGRGLNVYLGLPDISPGLTLRVGDGLKLNAHVLLRCRAEAGAFTIGDHCAIGYDVSVLVDTLISLGHRVRLADRVVLGGTREAGAGAGARVTIGDDVWVGTGAIVGDGVTIGPGAIVAAGAVVTQDVPPHTVVAGNPARVVRALPGAGSP